MYPVCLQRSGPPLHAKILRAWHHQIDFYSKDKINQTVENLISNLSKKDHYFIFSSKSESKRLVFYNNYSCIKTEKVNLASFNLTTTCGNTIISLGIWPKDMGYLLYEVRCAEIYLMNEIILSYLVLILCTDFQVL